jgi:hypothetical protein
MIKFQNFLGLCPLDPRWGALERAPPQPPSHKRSHLGERIAQALFAPNSKFGANLLISNLLLWHFRFLVTLVIAVK